MNNKRNIYQIVLTVAVVVLAVVGGFWYGRIRHHTVVSSPTVGGGQTQTYNVVLSADGFSPNPLTIHQNDTVIFSTKAGKTFWPASDPHPIHDIYPEFDPKRPIAEDSTWSFTFTKIGDWKYHDHLFPVTRGEIIVTAASASNGKTSQPATLAAAQCGSDKNSQGCIDRQMNDALKSKNLDAAFEVLGNLYQADPGFASSCHTYAHELGQLAYEKFSQHVDFQLSAKSYYCGYGFYHGFMEALLHDTGSVAEAKDFCAYVGKHFTDSGSQAETACYHGIGHGAVDGETSNYKTAEDYIAPALALCEKIQGTHEQSKLCASGVYNALAVIWNTGSGDLPQDSAHPFAICAEQKNEAFAEGCYHQMNTVVEKLVDGDIVKGFQQVQKITDPAFATIAMDGLASSFGDAAKFAPDTYKRVIAACHGVRTALQNACFTGFASGIIEGGAPGHEYDNAIPFCANKLLTASEKDSCFQRLASTLPIWYPSDKAQEVCNLLPGEYRKYCVS